MACQSNNLARAQSKFPPPPTLNPPAGFPPLRALSTSGSSSRSEPANFFPHVAVEAKRCLLRRELRRRRRRRSCEGGFELDLSCCRRGSPGSRRRPRQPGRTCFHRRALLVPSTQLLLFPPSVELHLSRYRRARRRQAALHRRSWPPGPPHPFPLPRPPFVREQASCPWWCSSHKFCGFRKVLPLS